MADSDKNNPPAVKQGAVTPRRLRVEGFRGAFLDARFSNDGVSEEAVSVETEKAIKEQYPKAKVEPVREERTEDKK